VSSSAETAIEIASVATCPLWPKLQSKLHPWQRILFGRNRNRNRTWQRVPFGRNRSRNRIRGNVSSSAKIEIEIAPVATCPLRPKPQSKSHPWQRVLFGRLRIAQTSFLINIRFFEQSHQLVISIVVVFLPHKRKVKILFASHFSHSKSVKGRKSSNFSKKLKKKYENVKFTATVKMFSQKKQAQPQPIKQMLFSLMKSLHKFNLLNTDNTSDN
jgi:hypothetical protein